MADSGTPAPWCVQEQWEIGIALGGKAFARVTGRTNAPAALKCNPLWWTQNTFEQQVAEWYHPDWPQWRRQLYWNYFRNPLQNARAFVWGWADQNYTVVVDEGYPDALVVQRNDVILPDGRRDKGFQRCTLARADGAIRKFVSYCDDKLVWYYGTQPSGFYGAKFNLHKPSSGYSD